MDPKIGWIYDRKRISEAMAPLLEARGHGYWNGIEGPESPAIEMISSWIWRKLDPDLPGRFEVEVQETATSRCSFRGEF